VLFAPQPNAQLGFRLKIVGAFVVQSVGAALPSIFSLPH